MGLASLMNKATTRLRTATGRGGLYGFALAAASIAGCVHQGIPGQDGTVAIMERHVDADRLGALVNTTPTLNGAIAKIGDPWTRILSPAEAQAFQDDVTYKTAAGVGLPELLAVDLDVRGYAVQIVDPQPGSPAAKAGLKTGDILESIDGQASEGRPWKDVIAALRVPEGKTITLAVRNRQDGLRDVKLTSERLTPPVMVEKRVAEGATPAIVLRGFTESTPNEVSAAIESLNPDELVLDVRDNPGGSVAAMLAVAGLFTGPQPVLAMRGGKGSDETLRATGQQRFTGKLTVLVNEGTASAAEALAVGLRHARRATVVGRKTFGKCLVHDLFRMKDGRSLLFTVGRLHAPGQRPWCTEGVAPDNAG
jgi:carboxyl-terminal processing protease